MAKIRVSKIFDFEMAHALWGYDGKCSNVHGHSYRLTVTVEGAVRNEPGHPKDGMVVDFADLKAIVKQQVVDVYDHALVINELTPEELVHMLQKYYHKLYLTSWQPTCENLLLEYVRRIRRHLPEGLELVYAKLQETATSYAEWGLK